MAKAMAQIDKMGIVANVLWCSDTEPERGTLKNVGDRPVGMGDTYANGKWYRNGEEILTPLEEAWEEAARLQKQLDSLDEAYREGVNSV